MNTPECEDNLLRVSVYVKPDKRSYDTVHIRKPGNKYYNSYFFFFLKKNNKCCDPINTQGLRIFIQGRRYSRCTS